MSNSNTTTAGPAEGKEEAVEQRFAPYDLMDIENDIEAAKAALDGKFFGVTDEEAGGIIAYTMSLEVSKTIADALNQTTKGKNNEQ